MRNFLMSIMVLAFSGCFEIQEQELIINGNSSKKHKESDLVPEFNPVRHNDTVILKLENNNAGNGDTGTAGVDVITYEFTHPVKQKVCLEKHEEIKYRLVIKDQNETEVLIVEDGECQTFMASASLYHFHISYSSASASTLLGENSAVFIRPLAETTHCEDYQPINFQIEQEPTLQVTTGNHCTADPNLICNIPKTYSDIPANCTLPGPWRHSETNCTYYSAYDCGTHRSNQCSKNVSGCQNVWKYRLDNLDGDCGDQYDNWGPCYSSSEFWVNCFGGNYDQAFSYKSKAGDVIKTAYRNYVDQYCAGTVFSDCNDAWTETSEPPNNCIGFKEYVKFGNLELSSGETAIYLREYLQVGRNDYMPKADDVLMVLNGRCDNIPHRIGAYITGPQTQIVIYPFTDLTGKPLVFSNDSKVENKIIKVPEVNLPDQGSIDPAFKDIIRSNALSLTVTSRTGTEEDLCRIKDVGLICDNPTKWDIAPKMTGEVVLVKMTDVTIKAGTNCSAAFLFDYRCDDLNKLGLKNYGMGVDVPQVLKEAVIFDSDTVLRSFSKKEFKGDVKVSQGSGSSPLTVELDAETVSSIHVYKLPGYNHTILISLRKCCGCDLHEVEFRDEDLTHTVLVGSNLAGASFVDVDLTGADLRMTSLRNAKFNNVNLGENYLGCADMSGADMSDPANSSKSKTIVSAGFNWEVSTTNNGIAVSCSDGDTYLTSAKIPLTILPKESWKTIRLQNAALLDKIDGYDLSGIDMSGSNLRGLRAGGKILNMQGADLSGSDLTDADLSSIDFSPLIKNDNAKYTNFSNTKIGGASFANANLEGADFNIVSVDGISGSVNFSYALLMNSVLTNVDLGKADFSYAYFFSKFKDNVTVQKKAIAENIVAQDAIFTGSFLSNMTFTNLISKNSNFNGAQMVGTKFNSSDLSNSKFSDAYMHGADLTGSLITDASFSGAYFSLNDGYWHYTSNDPECSEIRINYKKTQLGDTSMVLCPNGEKGPCDNDEKLSRKDKKIAEPPCVDGEDDIFGNTDCITHEYLEKNTIPKCDQSNKDVMQCGCLISQ